MERLPSACGPHSASLKLAGDIVCARQFLLRVEVEFLDALHEQTEKKALIGFVW